MLRSQSITLAALIGSGMAFSSVQAGWLSVKNDTKAAVLIQDVPANVAAKRGKPVRLLPGEVYREYHAEAGEKEIQVLDAKSPSQVLCEAKVKWPTDDVTVRVRTIGSATKLEPIAGKPGAAEAVVLTATKKP
jgi:hypothetical protein